MALVVAALADRRGGLRRRRLEQSSSTQIEGLGTTLEEIQANAKEEGEVNLINWAGYVEKDWTDAFVSADRLQGQLEGRRAAPTRWSR